MEEGLHEGGHGGGVRGRQAKDIRDGNGRQADGLAVVLHALEDDIHHLGEAGLRCGLVHLALGKQEDVVACAHRLRGGGEERSSVSAWDMWVMGS